MLRINSIEIKAYVHATEDEGKVVKVIHHLLPSDLRSRVKISRQIVKGYYGNPIKILSIRIKGRDAEEVVKTIFGNMSDTEKSIVKASFQIRFDPMGNKLYLRLDKQELYRGRIVVSDSDDVVHITISLRGRGGVGDALKLFEEMKLF